MMHWERKHIMWKRFEKVACTTSEKQKKINNIRKI